jgi:hypothetical protein
MVLHIADLEVLGTWPGFDIRKQSQEFIIFFEPLSGLSYQPVSRRVLFLVYSKATGPAAETSSRFHNVEPIFVHLFDLLFQFYKIVLKQKYCSGA